MGSRVRGRAPRASWALARRRWACNRARRHRAGFVSLTVHEASDHPVELDRRLLVVTYHYPPDESIGGMRWAGLGKYLARLGWRTWVVTAAGTGAAPVAGVSVHSCPRRRTWNDRYQEARRAAARADSGARDRAGGVARDGSADAFPGLGMACAGTIYGGRNPSPVLRGLRLFLERHPEAAASGTRLRIAGHMDESAVRNLHDETASLGLGAYVEYCGVLPRTAALRLVGRSRVAFVLAQEQELQVPAKLYETVALGVRTIVVASETSAAASEARRLGACAVDPGDVTGIAQLLGDAWQEPKGAGRGGGERADYAAVAALAARVLAEHAAGRA